MAAETQKYTTHRDRILAKDGSVMAIALANGHHGSFDVADVLRDKLNSVDDLVGALQQIERLSREADGNLVDVRAMLGDISRAALNKVHAL